MAEAEAKKAQAEAKKAESEARKAEAEFKKDIAKIEAEAGANRAKQEAEQKIALEKAKADAQERAYALEMQKLHEQNELEVRARVQKTLAVAIPVLGCILIGTIFIIAIRRRARESAQARGDGK